MGIRLRLWLDDVREAPEGWVRVFTAREAIAVLDLTHADVIEVSLDHDLGQDDVDQNGETGYTVAKWIEAECAHDRWVVPTTVHIHSANPVGSMSMLAAIRSAGRFCPHVQVGRVWEAPMFQKGFD